ncbi:MAG TPA: divalent metal cation transporter [Rhodopila sp.]|nr:divalent metal cation transporter [Rhodopila sp.]
MADDDPSGIATYSQAGAQLGLNILWTMPVALPLMAAIQSMCARIGRVTGKGLAANIATEFSPPVLHGVVLLLVVANVLNIAADVAAMGETAELVTGFNRHAMTFVFVLGTVLLQLFIPYHRYVVYLKWLTTSLLAYAAVLFVVHVPWGEVVLRTVWPKLTFNSETATTIVGVFGTTISPYLFFWQASEEIEEMRRHTDASPLLGSAGDARKELSRINWDTWSGMLYSDAASFCIILATAVTLNVAGINDINTAAEAAAALRPLGGDFTYLLFALGILGVGLIGVPVLAGSAAYAVSEAVGWRWGLENRVSDARGFYGVIAVSVICGLLLQYSPITPMKALFWSAVVNGVVAVPLIVIVILLASRKAVLGPYTSSRSIVGLGWIAAAVMGAAALRMILPG